MNRGIFSRPRLGPRPIKKAVEEFCLWDIMLCSPLKVSQRFTGIYCLSLQG
jgi:hypothetical protein